MNSFIATLDASVNAFMERAVTPTLESIASFVSTLVDAEVLIVLTLLLAAYFIYKRKWHESVVILFSVGIASVVIQILKQSFMRLRPGNALELIVNDPSFPSGHAGISAAFFLALIYIYFLHVRSHKRRVWAFSIGVTIVFLVGLSRLILNVHWFSDVLVGWCIGDIAALIAILIAQRFLTKKR